jgi:uncharacterized protein YgiM (DUF1202 family)
MRRIAFVILVGITLASVATARQKTMNVQVREAQIRQTPGFLSRVVATVPYTESVNILEEKNDWYQVQTTDGKQTGWMHNTALTKKKLKLSGDGPDAQMSVTSDEQALAGKGFNSDVEKQFKDRNAKIDFAVVDKMEALKIPIKDVQAFLVQGNVSPAKGGAK